MSVEFVPVPMERWTLRCRRGHEIKVETDTNGWIPVYCPECGGGTVGGVPLRSVGDPEPFTADLPLIGGDPDA